VASGYCEGCCLDDPGEIHSPVLWYILAKNSTDWDLDSKLFSLTGDLERPFKLKAHLSEYTFQLSKVLQEVKVFT